MITNGGSGTCEFHQFQIRSESKSQALFYSYNKVQ